MHGDPDRFVQTFNPRKFRGVACEFFNLLSAPSELARLRLYIAPCARSALAPAIEQ